MNITYKQGRVVLILKGKFAGCKATIISNNSNKTRSRFEGLFLLGIQRHFCKNFKKKGKNNFVEKNKIKIFLKKINKKHFFSTRYNIDFGKEGNRRIKEWIENYFMSKKKKIDYKLNFKKQKQFLKNLVIDRFLLNRNKWFFRKLNF